MQNTVNANQEGIAKERLAVGIKSEALDSAINNAELALSGDSSSNEMMGFFQGFSACFLILTGLPLFWKDFRDGIIYVLKSIDFERSHK